MSKASLELGGGNWAAKDGNLLGYAVGDTSGKYLPREFTFSRGADIAATRVNKDGLIEKYRENLLLHSNTFSNAVWAGASTTETGGQSGYDGTNNAWLLEKLVANGNIEQSVSASNLLTYSVYAKAGTKDWLRLNIVGLANAYFDLANGVVGSTGGAPAITSAMVNAGGGWWRCSFTYQNSSTTGVSIYVADADNDSSGTSGNIYIQDAQLEYGLVATDYIESGSSTGKAGVLDNLPRIDYTSGNAQLLMEPSRTNKLTHSEYFGDWSSSGVNLDLGYEAPDGTNSAYKISITGGSSERYLYKSGSVLSTDSRSIWAKTVSGTGTVNLLTYYENTNNLFTITNDWQRFEISSVTTSTGDTNFYAVDFRGDSTLTEVLIWGAQAETGSYATSYIPTYGAQDTRNADTCTTTSSNLISSQLFSMFFEHTPTGGGFSGSTPAFELNIQGTSDNVSFYVNNSGIDDGLNIYLGPTNGGYIWGTGTNDGWTVNQKSKVALTYDGDNLRYFINGVLHNSQTGVSFTDADTSLYITHAKGNKLEQALVFPTALTDQEAIALTTL